MSIPALHLTRSKSRCGALLACLLALTASAATAQFVADDFHACALNPAWTLVDPAADGATATIIGAYTDDAQLALSVPGGVTHEFWGTTIGAPHVLQPLADADFTATVKFTSVLPPNFGQEGLLVRQDDSHWLRLEFYRDGTGQLHVAAIGGPTTIFLDRPFPNVLLAPLYLRVVRVGDTWALGWSVDDVAWQSYGDPFLYDLQPNGLGLYAGNRGANPPAHTVLVDWLRLNGSGDDDTARNTLTTGVTGGGDVSRLPERASYDCGEVVTVTALDRPGWIFGGWSGARTGTVNPQEIAMSGPLALTATFMAVPVYALASNTVGGGSITLSPPGGSYNSGTEVTVTAVDGPGWAFSGWTGALTGPANPQNVTMSANRSLVATFTAVAQHTVTAVALPAGRGTVVLDPPGGTYNHGATVTLTTVTAPGFGFLGWSGDLTAAVNPAQLMVDGDKNVVAICAPLPNHLLATAVAGNGQIFRVPDLASYPAGSLVALTAVPDDGYRFSGWSGDLSGMATPDTIRMDADRSVQAAFAVIPPVFASDDFNRCALGEPWTVVDPYGDGGTATMYGGYAGNAGVALSVPGGFEHEIWNGFIGATHILQPARNVDFTVEARFEADLPGNFGQEGILIKENGMRWVRAEIFRDEVNLLRVAVDRGPNLMTHDVYLPAGVAPPLWMRVTRTGDTFVQSWSADGTTWTVAGAPFTYAMNVTAVGLFAGNRGYAPPAHTVLVDYFTNTAGAPTGEDAGLAPLTVELVGGGSVSRALDLPSYPCGQAEQLTAVPHAGWQFAGWSGHATGTQNPLMLTMSGATMVTARFENGLSPVPEGLVSRLRPCVPNPFNPSTVVAFDLAQPGTVSLVVYGLDGRRVRVLAEGAFAAGRHERLWDGRDQGGRRLGSGVYFVRLLTADGTSVGRVAMLK